MMCPLLSSLFPEPVVSREILATTSYDQSVAWIGARLADALDYAFSKGVAHGDVKPSNILLTADGTPMLLDFNLAREGLPLGSIDNVGDPGGTVAYMAPERLSALASEFVRVDMMSLSEPADCLAHVPISPRESVRGGAPSDSNVHQADIYSLGLVLLEAMTTRIPSPLNPGPAVTISAGSSSVESAARFYAQARLRIARVVIDEAEASSGRRIPPGLRAILEHALDPVPKRRYYRASDFAEDLDRWRSDRPLAFAPEPFWRHTIPSWMRRRQRLLLVAAASLSLVLGLPISILILSARRTHADIAHSKVDRHWASVDAYPFRPMTSDWLEDPFRSSNSFRLTDPADSGALELAGHALEDFGVLGTADWRPGESFGYLLPPEREDLELWLLEQAYRYCLALAERPNSSHDWERARNLLNHLAEAKSLPIFAMLATRLNVQLQSAGSTAATFRGAEIRSDRLFGPVAHSAVTWGNEYLLGVAAKYEFDAAEDSPHQSPDNLAGLDWA